MRGRFWQTFHFRLIVFCGLPILLAQTTWALLESRHITTEIENDLVAEVRMLSEATQPAMRKAMWDFDISMMTELAAGLALLEPIGHVDVLGPIGERLVARSAPHFVPGTDDILVLQPIRYDMEKTALHSGRQEAGTLVVRASREPIKAWARAAMRRDIIKSAALASLILVIFSATVLRMSAPLRSMVAAIGRLGSPDFDGRIPGGHRRDELGALARSLVQQHRTLVSLAQLRDADDVRLRTENQRIRYALQSTSDAILLTDKDLIITFMNEACRSLMPDARVGDRAQMAHIALDDVNHDEVRRAIASRSTFRLRLRGVDASGEERHLLLRGAPIRSAGNCAMGLLFVATDDTAHQREAARARYLAEHDSLTGLANRRLLEQRLQEIVVEEGTAATVLLADLDRFKEINDTLGHMVGDDLLKDIATLFGECMPDAEMVCRLGGDEFAVLAKGNRTEEIHAAATHMIEILGYPRSVDGLILYTGMSAGVAVIDGSSAPSRCLGQDEMPAPQDACRDVKAGAPLDVIRRADLALYEAKRAGRGQVRTYRIALENEPRRRAMIEAELRRSLLSDDLHLVFQKQTEAEGGAIASYEALVRWDHPTLGPVSPSEFIPVAEASDLIADLTRQTLKRSGEFALKARETGFRGRVAVNLSGALIGNGADEMVMDALLEVGCPMDHIELEITEGILLSNGETARREIDMLRSKGARVALDDFGMGYSSLSYLSKYPVDTIKIDRAFVSKIIEEPETNAIVEAIIRLGHALGMTVTAEGVECAEQRHRLVSLGADHVQGWIDGMPMVMDDVLVELRGLQGAEVSGTGVKARAQNSSKSCAA